MSDNPSDDNVRQFVIPPELSRHTGPKKCWHETGFTVDFDNGDVFCTGCREKVSAAHALITLARHRERNARERESRRIEAESLAKWVPQLKAVRRLHRRWKGKKLLPACPHCHQPIRAEDLDKEYIRARKPD